MPFRSEDPREIGILQDVPGPKLRIGPVEGGMVRLHTGSDLVLTAERIEGNSERLSVAWPGLLLEGVPSLSEPSMSDAIITEPTRRAYGSSGSLR